MVSAFRKYLINVLLGLDETGNALAGGDGEETISSRVGKAQRAGKWWAVHIAAPFINWLLKNPNHCKESIEDDRGAKAVIPDA